MLPNHIYDLLVPILVLVHNNSLCSHLVPALGELVTIIDEHVAAIDVNSSSNAELTPIVIFD